MTTKAVIVFSGGQDSTTCLIHSLPQYDEVHCLTFDYGQRHREEIAVAQQLSMLAHVPANFLSQATAAESPLHAA